MGMEVVGAEAASAQVKVADGEVNLFQDKESKATAKEREEAVVFGSDNGKAAANDSDMAPPKDAVEEWPEPKQTYTFYFIKIRSFEDPKLRAKLEQADKDFQNKIQARSKIFEAIKAKKTERSSIIQELRPLSAENKQYNEAVNEKLKEMEPFRNRLGKFRDENNAMRAESAGLCSSIEELEQTIKRLNDRICHESISLDEEKRLIKEIKNLEKTRSKVNFNAAKRAKIQDTVVERDAIQDQVKIIGEGIDGVKKERQAVRSKIKVLEDELKAVDAEIASLQEDLNAATARKDKAYESLTELRQARDVNNTSFHQNRVVMNKARDYSSRNERAELQELHKTEVEKFMTQWCSSKAFREDYEKRILSSLNGRQLTRDGRMRNPDEKPIFIETQQPAAPVEQEPIPVKMPSKQAKEAPAPQAAAAAKAEPLAKADVKSAKVKAALDADDADVAEPAKEKPKPKEVDVAKLKEIKRQEEIEKNRLALERKKKQAEKQAAKAAARAQKEAEKKLKGPNRTVRGGPYFLRMSPPPRKTHHFAMDREALRMVCSPEFWRMGVLWTLSLLYSYLLLFLRGRSTTPCRRRPGPHVGGGGGGRRICVITGATSGLGKAAAAALAREGYHVVLAGRSAQLLSETAQEIREQQPDAYVEAFQVDLSSYKSIKKFETSLNQWIQDLNLEPSIQILINNAGMLAKSHRVTEDGLDEMMQTNYIGPFILTNILLPLLKNSSVPSRVVNLTSFTHRCVSEIDVSEEALRGRKFGQWSVGRSYPLASTYEYTKLCLLMFSYELHRQLHMSSDVSVMAADPGVVETSIMRELPPCLSWFALFVLRFLNLLQKPHTGVGAVLDAALAPPVTFLLINRETVLIFQQNNVLTSTTNFELYVMFVVFQEASGKYFFGGKRRTIRSSALSYDIDVAKKLWAESSALFQELQLRDLSIEE